MSFSVTLPRCDSDEEFADAVYASTPTPKADGRTKEGKLQKLLESTAKDSLTDMAYTLRGHESGFSGSISGHVAPDLTGYVSVQIQLLAPLPAE